MFRPASLPAPLVPGSWRTLRRRPPRGYLVSLVGFAISAVAFAGDPVLSVPDSSAAEGEAVVFVLTLSEPSGSTVELDYQVDDGNTDGEEDLALVSGSLVFTPGQTEKTVAVPTVEDDLYELDEFFTFRMTNVVGATLSGGATAAGTIENDDDPPELTVDDVMVDEDAGQVTTVVRLSEPSGAGTLVFWGTAFPHLGTAEAGLDFQVQTATIFAIPTGETEYQLTLPIHDDAIDEEDETFVIRASGGGGGYVPVKPDGWVTILDDDPMPTLAVSDVSAGEGEDLVFSVGLTGATERTVEVDFTTTAGNATADLDFAPVSGTIELAPGETAATVTVTTFDDELHEAQERVFLDLADPTHASLDDDRGRGTITDDDPMPTLSVGDATVLEGGDLEFEITLSTVSGRATNFGVQAVPGTAEPDSDYEPPEGRALAVPIGATSTTVLVTTLEDTVEEDDETLTLEVVSVFGATVGDGAGDGLIVDDDAVPALSVDDVQVEEGDLGTTTAVFVVRLDQAVGNEATVDFHTEDGTAIAGDDFEEYFGSLVFSPGETEELVEVTIWGDSEYEGAETFELVLTSPTGATLEDDRAVGTITNDDPCEGCEIFDDGFESGDAGAWD